jgi:hypothetical protein
MDEKFWNQLDATRRAMERASAGIDMSKITLAGENAAKLYGTIDFERLSSTYALASNALQQYERYSANSALVGETIDSMLTRYSALSNVPSTIFASAHLTTPALTGLKVPEISSRLHELTRLNDAVSSAMRSIHFDNLATSDRSLGRRIISLSDSYRNLFAGLSRIEFAVPDFVTSLPARDMIVKSTIISSRATDFEPSEAQIDLEDPAHARSDVDLMLAELNPDYVAVLDEAFEAFSGRSRGRTRHVLVSLREIITHVLHDLSPDDELRAWSTDPKYFHEDKPTRAARHLYICRFVNCGPYSDYVKKSSDMTSAFFKALNGLHDVRPDICEFQIRLMVTDALNILRFLLRTAKYRP